MTSEVLILNKRAVVLAADSAVTVSSVGGQDRYSKSANKIFEVSQGGRIAAAIYGSAQVDLVPWEVAIKLFRGHLADNTFPTVDHYVDAFMQFLSGHARLFPSELLDDFSNFQFDKALVRVLHTAKEEDPTIVDPAVELADRQTRWTAVAANIRQVLNDGGVAESLTPAALAACLADPRWTQRAQEQLAQTAGVLDGVSAAELAELGTRLRYTRPDLILGSTGIVFAGYGEEQIFPAFNQVEVFGHVGHELFHRPGNKFAVTHGGSSMIQPLAQTSMIEVFTDGFGWSLRSIIEGASRKAVDNVFNELENSGVDVPAALKASTSARVHEAFMQEWTQENWKKNFNPLIGVIATLNVDEMAHLAETLLVLESLKERVTSPSESVGGPIDVAAITVSEGLVWIKRKHYFDPTLNLRYSSRLQRSLTPR